MAPRIATKMMKIGALALAFWLGFAPDCARAADAVKFMLIYPGGEGDRQEAGTLMGLFSDALRQISGVPMAAEYHSQRQNSVKLGLNRALTLLLMRVDTYLEWKEAGVKLSPALVTQPSFDNGPLVYHIYGHIHTAKNALQQSAASAKPPCDKLFLGIDLNERFVQALFGDKWKSVPLSMSDAPLDKLEAIAQQSISGLGASSGAGAKGQGDCILLESRQWQSLKAIPFLWKDNLTLIQESVPTLHPLIFTFEKPAPSVQKVVEALKRLPERPENQELLMELQVKAFAPLSEAEAKALQDWERRYESAHAAP